MRGGHYMGEHCMRWGHYMGGPCKRGGHITQETVGEGNIRWEDTQRGTLPGKTSDSHLGNLPTFG